MESDRRPRVLVNTAGPLWFIGWLFTVAFAKMTFWPAILALVLWPYYLGVAVR